MPTALQSFEAQLARWQAELERLRTVSSEQAARIEELEARYGCTQLNVSPFCLHLACQLQYPRGCLIGKFNKTHQLHLMRVIRVL